MLYDIIVSSECTANIYLTGVYFQLSGVNYNNNSIVSITDIGEGNSDSLLCFTNNINCCESLRRGEWYFPNNMSEVRTEGEGYSFYRDRGQSVVRLHRRHNATIPTGPFCCEIPDANYATQRVCITVEFGTDQHDYVTTMITPGTYNTQY